jgi:catalase
MSKIGKDKGASAQAQEFETEIGEGGELHQVAGKDVDTLTTQQGIPVADDQNSLKVGSRGATLLEDFHFREKMFHFDHERIPERVVHARGYGVHGRFVLNESLAEYTTAKVLTEVGEETPMFVRFSTVAGNKGSSDLARDVRGFAAKFYTKEGNWDIVGNNIPVFFIQDAIKFPDLIHAAKQEPDRGFPQAQTAHDNFWDFICLTPESMHMIIWIMSDRTIPRSFRFMEGFGVHSFRLINAEGNRPTSSSTSSPRWVCNRSSGTRRSRSTAQIPTFIVATFGMRLISARRLNGTWACSCSTMSSPKASNSISSTQPRLSRKNRYR